MVDIVHHALIGGAGYLIAAENGHDLAGMAFAAGSVFPDLDVLFMVFGKRFYLRNHQGITHSLILAPLYALAVAAPLLAIAGFEWAIVAGALAGLVVHVTLDLTNTFRIALLSPLTARRFSLDAMFFVDGVALMLTAGFYAAWLWFGWREAAWLYPASFAAYLLAKFFLQRHVRRATGCVAAIPSAWNPFEFYLLERDGERWITSTHSVVSGRRSRHVVDAPDPASRALATKSALYGDMRAILRRLEITTVERTPAGTTLEATDIAVRNFGGKFGKTTLTFDRDGNLTDERAAI